MSFKILNSGCLNYVCQRVSEHISYCIRVGRYHHQFREVYLARCA